MSVPPATIETCRVLLYLVFEQAPTVGPTFFSGDKQVDPATRLVICQSSEGHGFRLLFCNDDWVSLGSNLFESLEHAKTSAEECYPESSLTWIDALITEEDAAKHLEELWGPHRCVFCGKSPLDFKDNPRFIEKNGRAICADCVMTCYEILREDDAESAQP